MAGEKLSKRVVDRLEVRAKDYIVFDGELPGFGVRVMPNGKRFYLIQYRRHGRTRRMALGQHGVMTAEIARREANRMLGAVRGGGADPATLRDMERQAATVQELGARFLKEHVAVRCKRPPTTSTGAPSSSSSTRSSGSRGCGRSPRPTWRSCMGSMPIRPTNRTESWASSPR